MDDTVQVQPNLTVSPLVASSPQPSNDSKSSRFLRNLVTSLSIVFILMAVVGGAFIFFSKATPKRNISNTPTITPVATKTFLNAKYINPFDESVISLYVNPFSAYINQLVLLQPNKKITYPVAELSSCHNRKQCAQYCSNSMNESVCTNFAKEMGMYQDPANFNDVNLVASAEKELNCSTREACEGVCSITKEENLQKCTDFAKKYKIAGGKQNNIFADTILPKAKEKLDCATLESCQAFCAKEENQQKCIDFAEKYNIAGGIVKIGQ